MKRIVTLFMSLTLLCSILFLNACAIDSKKKSDASKQPIKVDPEIEKEFKQAIVLLKSDNFTQAIDVLKSVIQKEKRLTAPYVNLAMAYQRSGDETKAEEAFLNVLKLDSANPVANNELGQMMRKRGKFAEARKYYQAALVEHPDYLPVLKNLGILCDLYLQDYGCALEQFEKYLELQPEDKTMKIWVSDVKTRV